MKGTLLILSVSMLLLAGCSGTDNGDVAAAENAAKSAPKTAAELPKEMPAQAQKNAAAAMGAQQAMADQMSKNPPPLPMK